MKTFRWIVTPPAAILCGYLAYLIGGFVNNLSLTLFLGSPPDGWMKVATDVMAHSYMGAVFIYSAVRIAPSKSKYVAFASSALLLMFAALSLWSSIEIGKFYALPAIGGLLFGGLVVLYATLAGQVIPYRGSNRQQGMNA